MTITTPAFIKSLIAFLFGVSIPLTLNPNNPISVIAGFVGGVTTATVVNNSVSSRKKEEFTLPVNDGVTLVTEGKIIDKQSVVKLQDSSLKTQSNGNQLITLLEEKGIEVIKHRQPQEEDELLDPIANYLGKNYSVLQKLHSKIKASIIHKTKFSFNLYGNNQQEIQRCTQYCNKLYRATLLSHYYYDKRKKVIHGTVQRRGDIIQFLNGGWFERAILNQVKEQFAERDHVEFLVNPHLKFENGDRFELDILFLVDNQLFWIECKTGNHYNDHLPKYCQHLKVLGVVKERAFLVGLGLSDRDAEKWTKLWTITVVNPEGLVSRL